MPVDQSLAVSIRVKAMAMEFPPRCDPANIQFLRPMARASWRVRRCCCPAPESRCRGRAVFWAYGPRHIEWPLPKVICPIFWAIGRATILPDHRRWALHFLDAEQHASRLAPCLLHTIQLRNPLDGLLGNGGTLCANTSTNLRRMWAMQATSVALPSPNTPLKPA